MKTSDQIKVRIIYRNYRPIHKIYQSLIDNPPQGVVYSVPPVRKRLSKLMPIYRKLRYFTIGRMAIHSIEKLFFLKKPKHEVDLYHYICMIDPKAPSRPYVVDMEHIASLLSFTYNLARINEVKLFLQNANCKAINCQSYAAKRTLEAALGPDYSSISGKVNVVYPSLVPPDENKLRPDYRYIKSDKTKLKILFVGNRAYLKGLEELLVSISKINQKFSPSKLDVHVISDDAGKLISEYKLKNVFLYPPKFSEVQMITQFYMPADLLISPTKQDTYGMAIVDSLSCGTAVIATKQFAIPELITDGVDGILLETKKAILDNAIIPTRKDIDAIYHSNIDSDMVAQLTQRITDVLEGKIDLKKLGNNGKKKFVSGAKLAATTRNKQLLEIYKKALG